MTTIPMIDRKRGTLSLSGCPIPKNSFLGTSEVDEKQLRMNEIMCLQMPAMSMLAL